jgi:hypothetical protein
MSTQEPKKPDGKPSKENAGERDKPRADDDRGKPTIEPGKHDASVRERGGVITDESEAG